MKIRSYLFFYLLLLLQDPLKLLEAPLLRRSTEKAGMIDQNFPGFVHLFMRNVLSITFMDCWVKPLLRTRHRHSSFVACHLSLRLVNRIESGDLGRPKTLTLFGQIIDCISLFIIFTMLFIGLYCNHTSLIFYAWSSFIWLACEFNFKTSFIRHGFQMTALFLLALVATVSSWFTDLLLILLMFSKFSFTYFTSGSCDAS